MKKGITNAKQPTPRYKRGVEESPVEKTKEPLPHPESGSFFFFFLLLPFGGGREGAP
jgi:hypothetical protein